MGVDAVDCNADLVKEVVEIDQRSRSNAKRLDRLEAIVDSVYELTTSVKLLAEKQDRMATSMDKVSEKVEALESKPAKKWDGLVDKIISILIAAALGFFLAKVGIQ